MNTGNIKKILTLVAIFPLLSACGSLSTATISNGLDRKRLTYAEAQEAIANGANVKDDFAGNCFVKQAADQKRWDLVVLFIENGANPWEAPRGKHSPFSTFNFIVDPSKDIPDETRLQILDLCLAHKGDSPVVAEQQATAFVSDPNARPSEFRSAAISKIAESGLAAASIEKLRQKEAEKATNDLLYACSNKTLIASEVNTWIALGANVNATTDKGYSVLFVAEQRNQPAEVLTALVAAGAVKNEIDMATERQLAENAKKQAEEATESLISRAKNNSLNTSNLSVLLQQGANVNATDKDGHSVLFLVEQGAPDEDAENGRFRRHTRCNEAVLNALSAAGAKKNRVDETAELLELCKNYKYKDENYEGALKADAERVKALIEAGVDVNTHDKDGSSPLFLAELNEKTEIIPLLTQAGAKMNPDEPQKLKEDATEKLFKLTDELSPQDVKEKAEMYINRGANVNAKNKGGYSLLFMALRAQTAKSGVGSMTAAATKDSSAALGMKQAGEEATAVMKALAGDNGEGLFSNPLCATLIAAGAEASKDEMTQIYFMNLKTGNWAFIKELRDHNFDLKAEGNGGKNAFHVMSESPHVAPNDSVIDALLKAGVNIEKKAEFDDAFLTPLGYAVYNKHVAAVRALLAHGANPKASVVIKDAMGNRSESIIDLARSRYNELKQTKDLLMAQRMTPDVVQTIHAADAAMRDYQEIILMLR